MEWPDRAEGLDLVLQAIEGGPVFTARHQIPVPPRQAYLGRFAQEKEFCHRGVRAEGGQLLQR